MKYENARDLLPEHLLRQVQKYISGKLVYIPARERKRQWGAVSGYRQYLQERNRSIRAQYAMGDSMEALAEEYHLSHDSIRKIVYNGKDAIRMPYQGTLSSAQEWARQGNLEEWVHMYLLTDGHNQPFSDGLKIVDRIFLGPIEMPLDLFQRCTGPTEEGLKYQIHPEAWEKKVQQLMKVVAGKQDIPPMIVHYLIPEGEEEGVFELNDGNHRWEACRRMNVEKAFVIVWITDRDEYEQFMERFGGYLNEARG